MRKKYLLLKASIILIGIACIIFVLSANFISSIALSTGLNVNTTVSVSYSNLQNDENLFCIQKGEKFYGINTYKVIKKESINSQNATKKAKTLAYILASTRTYTYNHSTDPKQKALWTFVNDHQNDKDLFGNLTATSTFREENNSIYNKAKDFADYTPQKPTISLTPTTGNKGKVNITNFSDNDFQKIVKITVVYRGDRDDEEYTNPDREISHYDEIKRVKVKYYTTQVKADYITLENVNEQNLLYGKGTITKKYNTMKLEAGTTSSDAGEFSLQKYIVQRNSENFSWRENRIIYDPSNNLDNDESHPYSHNIAKAPVYAANYDIPKDSNPVVIKEGDVIVYRINVYDNEGTGSKAVKVRDWLPDGAQLQTVWVMEDFDKNGNEISTEVYNVNSGTYLNGEYGIEALNFKIINKDENNNPKEIQWKFVDFAEGKVLRIEVTVKFTTAIYGRLLNNEAWIHSVAEGNKENYRQRDADYVKFEEPKVYSVGLEKFITNVSGYQKNETISNSNREGNPQWAPKLTGYDNNGNAIIEANYTKRDAPVEAEKGDFVTYTIRIYNTGEQPVYVKQVYDVIDPNLDFESCSQNSYFAQNSEFIASLESIGGNERIGSVIQININGGNGVSIQAGGYYDVSITFKINVTAEEIRSDKVIMNNALVLQIYDEAGTTVVNDADGGGNNWDYEYLKLYENTEQNKYKVNLEKYISAKQKTNGGTTTTTNFNNRSGKAEYGTHNTSSINSYKSDNPVEAETGNKITYTIKLTNEGISPIRGITVEDIIPSEFRKTRDNKPEITFSDSIIKNRTKIAEIKWNDFTNRFTIQFTGTNLLEENESISFTVTATIDESNVSTEVITNTAKIITIKNRNLCEVPDGCPHDNTDSDYFQLRDITIAGMVWNDKALEGKDAKTYSGLYEAGENKLKRN